MSTTQAQSPLETTLPSPSLLRRLAAMFYEFWLVLACCLVVMAVIIFIRVTLDPTPIAEGERAISGLWRIPSFLAAFATFSGFYLYFWHKNQQTLAMQTWRIKLINNDGSKPDFNALVKRLSMAIISFTCLGLGYWWVLIDKEKKSWHDRASNTRLVLTPKKKK